MLQHAAFSPRLSYAVFTPRFDLLPAGLPITSVSEADRCPGDVRIGYCWPRHASQWLLCPALGADSLPQLACISLSAAWTAMTSLKSC